MKKPAERAMQKQKIRGTGTISDGEGSLPVV